MKQSLWTGYLLLLSVMVAAAPAQPEPAPEPRALRFTKHIIDAELPAIAADVVDVDGDGLLDVVAAGGPSGGASEWSDLVYSYRAPDWEKQAVCKLEAGPGERGHPIILYLEAVDFTTSRSEAPPEVQPVEFAVADGRRGKVWWYRYNRQSGEWTGSVIVEDVEGVHGLACGDIDRDGYVDLLVPITRGFPKPGMVWARNPGRQGAGAGLWARHPLSDVPGLPQSQHYVRLVDVNRDGRLDALHGSTGNTGWFGFWLQPPDPVEVWELRVLPGAMRKATNLDAADMNGDGLVDLVGTEGHGTGVWLFSAPNYAPERINATLESPHCLALADLDGDGGMDIATCGYRSKRVSCLVRGSGGDWTERIMDTNQCAYDLKAVDLDTDGDKDLLLSGQNSGNLVWYENILGATPDK